MAPALTLRAFAAGDRFLLNRWLSEPHVAEWFGSRAIAEAETAIAQSSPSALVRMILLEDKVIGYAHAFDAALQGGAKAPALRDGVYAMTAIIGMAEARGQGHGAWALACLRDEVFATTLTGAVAVLVPLAREAAVRALERQGFHWCEVWRDAAHGACWVMLAERQTVVAARPLSGSP
jgi:aminoglycoside 6'-N-acetyltransferase